MKKKFLSCFLTAVILASLLVLPVSATNDVIEIVATEVGPSAVWTGDLPGPSTDYWYYFYNNNLNSVPWIEYEVNAESTGAYHVDFAWGGTTRAKIVVNGSEASSRTGSTSGESYTTTRKWATWQSCEMPVPLYAGKNTVRVELIPGMYNNNYWHAGVAAIKFTKIGDTPILGTTTKAMSGAKTNIPDVTFPVDPWIWLNISNLNEPLYIKWNMDFPKTGYYKARVGAKSNSVASITIEDQTSTLNNMTKLDTYCMQSTSRIGTKAPWYESGDIMYIEKGVHEVTYQMSLDARIDNQFQIKVAGFQFAEVEAPITHEGDFEINPLSPSRSSNASVVSNEISISSGNWAEYDVNVSEDASYYVNFNGSTPGSIQITANGETVNRRTGRSQDSNGIYTFRDEIQLNEGNNTIRLSTIGANSGTISKLSFTKLEKHQYTTSLNTAASGRTFTAAYKDGVGVDPWLFINDTLDAFPEGDTAPYVTLTVTIPKDGYYFPMAATAGTSKVNLSIDGESFPVNDNCTILSEPYKASGHSAASCTWLKSNDGISLTAGEHDVTLSLYSPSEDNWNASIGAIRFLEGTAPIVYDGDFYVNITNPVRLSGAQISENTISLASNQWIEYDVYVTEDASYYVNFTRENTEADKNFYISVTVNGETVNRKTGRIQNDDASYTFQDEIQLNKGRNTIRVATMGSNSGILSSLSFTKLYTTQYTTSMNVATGSRTFKESYKDITGVDPWLWINDSVTDYPDGSTSPFITFEVTIPKTGYYYPAIAKSGVDAIALNIAEESISFNDNCTVLPEAYQASGNSNAMCSMIRSNETVYLEAGTYDVTIILSAPAAENWNTFIGAVRFINYVELNLAITNATVDNAGVITVNYTAPAETSFYIIAANYTLINGVEELTAVSNAIPILGTNAPGRETINVGGSGDIFEIFVWDNLDTIKPLLVKTPVSQL